MLKSNLNIDIILCTFAVDNILVYRSLMLIEILNKFLDTTLIVEGLCLRLPALTSFSKLLICFFLSLNRRTKICNRYLKTLCQKCSLTKSDTKSIIIINCFIKDSSIRLKCNLCTRLISLAYFLKVIADISSFITLLIYLSITAYFNFKPVRKSINN